MNLKFHITETGLLGDGNGYLGAKPFQLLLLAYQYSANAIQVPIQTYDTLAHAKAGAVLLINSSYTLTWTDSGAGSQSVSNVIVAA